MSDDPRPMLTLDEAAARLHVSTKTLRRYIGAGLLDAYRLGPKLVRVQADDVERLLEHVPTVQRTPQPAAQVAAAQRSLRAFSLHMQADHIWPTNVLVVTKEEHRRLARP